MQGTGQGAAFNKEETQVSYFRLSQENKTFPSQDEEGNVFGSVVVTLPDGRIQTTNYNADFYDG